MSSCTLCRCIDVPILPAFPLFFFNDTATTEIYTLSLHDALPISGLTPSQLYVFMPPNLGGFFMVLSYRSEERFSRNAETDLVCRLLLEKKKKISDEGLLDL